MAKGTDDYALDSSLQFPLSIHEAGAPPRGESPPGSQPGGEVGGEKDLRTLRSSSKPRLHLRLGQSKEAEELWFPCGLFIHSLLRSFLCTASSSVFRTRAITSPIVNALLDGFTFLRSAYQPRRRYNSQTIKR